MSPVTPRLKKRHTSRSAKHYNGQSGRNVPFNSMTVRVNNDNDGKILGGAGGGGDVSHQYRATTLALARVSILQSLKFCMNKQC